MDTSTRPLGLAYLAWASTCFFWGTTYLAIRIGVEVIPPGLFAGVRFLIAGTLFAFILRAFGHRLPPRRHWPDLCLLGVVMLGLGNGLVVWGEQFVASGTAALVITTTPLWVALYSAATPPREPLRLPAILGIALGTLGVGLIFRRDIGLAATPDFFKGIASILCAAMSWAAGAVYSQRRKLPVSALPGAAFQMIAGGVFLTLIGLASGEVARFDIDTRSALAFAYLVVFGAMVGFTSFVYALSKLPASFVTTYAYINPVVAVLLGWLILAEPITPGLATAGLCILAGVALIKSGTVRAPARIDRGEPLAAPVAAPPSPLPPSVCDEPAKGK